VKRPDLPRTVHCGDDGSDVDGHKAAMHRYLKDGLLDDHRAKAAPVRRHAGCTLGDGWLPLLHKSQRRAQQPLRDVFDERLYKVLWAQDAYDANAVNEVIRYGMLHPTHKLVSPVPSNVRVHVGGLHETGGVPGNWAKDWICPAGTPIVAVERATVTRLSGKAPSSDGPDSIGAYGWSTWYRTPTGVLWFWTHFGLREPGLAVGDRLEPGTILGYVGDQDFRPDHIHGGNTHPLGSAAAKRHVTAVANAPQVTL